MQGDGGVTLCVTNPNFSNMTAYQLIESGSTT